MAREADAELSSEEQQLTGAMLKMELLDLIVNLGLLKFFIRVFRLEQQPMDEKNLDKSVITV